MNLSGGQLHEDHLADHLGDILIAHGIDPGHLELEISEGVLMGDVERTSAQLQALKDLGVELVVDDFGTGYSSLSFLRRCPVDVLKVDQAFVDGLGRDAGDSAIVTTIVSLAHTLGLRAVAEGVETSGQLDELRRLGCDGAQGFLVARPGTASDIAALLASSSE